MSSFDSAGSPASERSARRIAAVVLPRVRLESLTPSPSSSRERGEEVHAAPGHVRSNVLQGVLAIVVARPGSAIKDERSLLGNTRIDEVSPEAHAFGVRPGQTIAAARARASSLRVRVVHPNAVTGRLACLAEALLAFGATTSFGAHDGTSGLRPAWSTPGGTSPDTVWVDVTGCAHLVGGEEALAKKLAERARAIGHSCRIGVADGPRIAAQIAWHCREDVVIAGAGEGAAAMRALPVSALPIDGETARWLRSSGIRTVGHVQALARNAETRRGLALRFGARAAEVMALLDGDDRAPLAPYVPPAAPEEAVDLEYGVTSADAILFVAKRLSSQLAARLEGRAMGATRLELVLYLDRALAPPPGTLGVVRAPDGRSAHVVGIAVPTPLVRAAELFAVLRARLESFETRAPVLGAALRATDLAPRAPVALDLFVPEARADRALPRLVAELTADIGEGRVGVLALLNRWSMGDRTALVPFGARPSAPPRLASRVPAPTRMLPRAKLLASPPLVRVTMRLEAVEWWRRDDAERGDALGSAAETAGVLPAACRKDYGEAWIENARAPAWVEIDELGAKVKGWMD